MYGNVVEIKVDGKAFREELNRIGSRSRNLSGLMYELSLLMRKSVMRNFDAEGRDLAGNTHVWKRLSTRTAKERARKKGKGFAYHPILEQVGNLRRSISIGNNQNQAWVGTGKEYGITHQFGTRRVPKRPFLVFPLQDIEKYQKHIENYIRDRVIR